MGQTKIRPDVCELAGFAAANGICCLFDRQPLVPMAFSRNALDAVSLTTLDGGSPDAISRRCKRWLDDNAEGAAVAAVVCDGYVTIGGARKDALIVEGRMYSPERTHVKIAVPYRPHHHDGGFTIYRPKFIVDALEGHDLPSITQAFFRGLCSHELGGRIWRTCADESW